MSFAMNNRTHTNTQQNTHSNTHSNIQAVTRRDFFKRTAFAGGAGSASLLGGLSALGTASAQSATGYKALVCVYLNGGNDQSNTVVPTTNPAYNAYAAARPGLAVAQNSLLGLNPSGWAGQAIGLNAQLASLKTLFDQGKVALLANVGTLARPMSLAQSFS